MTKLQENFRLYQTHTHTHRDEMDLRNRGKHRVRRQDSGAESNWTTQIKRTFMIPVFNNLDSCK